MVATFVTKMLISVTPASRLMTAIELGRARPAMMIGRTAPTSGAEHGEQDEHRDRKADELGLDEVALDRLVELVLDERDAGDRRLDARPARRPGRRGARRRRPRPRAPR